eukprot:jgi/Tetstr1/430728/TSEL_020519.t1
MLRCTKGTGTGLVGAWGRRPPAPAQRRGPTALRAPARTARHAAPAGPRTRGPASHRCSRLACRASARVQDPGDEYRRNVGIMLLNGEGDAFAAVRVNDTRGYWQMPQGGIDAGEEPWPAALRELREETGVTDVELLAEAPGWYAYDFPPEARAKLHGGWAKYRGQAQKWFLVRLTGPETQIDISGIGEQREFTEWAWIPPERLPELVVPFKQEVYKLVVAEFSKAVPRGA